MFDRFKPYDIFISYKSHDVQIARLLADQLIASGKRVWFAEYQILVRRYSKFQAAIDAGIRRSRYGLAITNDRYAGSEYCQREMKQLLERCGFERVLEVRIPAEEDTRKLFPSLVNSPSHTGDRANEILEFINSQTGWTIDPIDLSDETLAPQLSEAVCMDWAYHLNGAGWTAVKPGVQRIADWTWSEWRENFGRIGLETSIRSGRTPMDFEGPELRNNDATFPFFMNLHAGPEFSPQAKRNRPNPDDREMYRELMTYLSRHLQRLRFARLHGLHLFFHSGFSQFAVTYRWKGYWTRKYSVILPHPKAHVPAEFVFTFGFNGPFEEYCRRVHKMDRLVASLQWEDEGRFIVYVSVRGEWSRLGPPEILGIFHTREEAEKLRDSRKDPNPDVFVRAHSERVFISEWGQQGREILVEYERKKQTQESLRE